MLFKKEHIKQILADEKTQTRRTGKRRYKVGHRYRLQHSWFEWTLIEILITRRFRQRLGDITPEQALKEGYSSVEGFRRVWREIHGSWDPELVVTVYEFKLCGEKQK